jgi:WD40 repeat protein
MLAFEPNRRILATTTGLELRLWDLTLTEAKVIKTLPHAYPIALSPDGHRLASGSYTDGHEIRIWDIDP